MVYFFTSLLGGKKMFTVREIEDELEKARTEYWERIRHTSRKINRIREKYTEAQIMAGKISQRDSTRWEELNAQELTYNKWLDALTMDVLKKINTRKRAWQRVPYGWNFALKERDLPHVTTRYYRAYFGVHYLIYLNWSKYQGQIVEGYEEISLLIRRHTIARAKGKEEFPFHMIKMQCTPSIENPLKERWDYSPIEVSPEMKAQLRKLMLTAWQRLQQELG